MNKMLDMEDRVVKLEQRMDAVEVRITPLGQPQDGDEHWQEVMEVEKRYEIAKEGLRDIVTLYAKSVGLTVLPETYVSMAEATLEKLGIESKPDCAPCDAQERPYKMLKSQFDIAHATLETIAKVEGIAGLNLENSPATQALQRLKGTLIPDSW